LIEKGADYEARNEYGWNPLHYGITHNTKIFNSIAVSLKHRLLDV
jgi:hypothetical protein